MVERRRWFERRFPTGQSAAALPDLLERLRGTPWRLEERTGTLVLADLTRRVDGAWSIQENAGHLLDLEVLWQGRLDDFLAGADTLRPADLQNRATEEADHNARSLEGLLEGFRAARAVTVSILESMTAEDRRRVARHPRLDQPMTVADLAHFVAEHDDHHLARITEIRTRLLRIGTA